MNANKTGELIKRLRLEKKLTQSQLADMLFVSDKAVSKWERGIGMPDISLLGELAEILEVPIESLLSGETGNQNEKGGNTVNMKNTKFYICPKCKNVIACRNEADISCCGRKLSPLQAVKAEENEKLDAVISDGELLVTSEHEMTKENYISFTALLTAESIMITRHFPEWNLHARYPRSRTAMLVWYSEKDGLFYQYVNAK